jgi:tetratricopeptide (TPR) repeat protein
VLRGRALAAAARLVEHYGADYPAAVALAGEALAIARAEADDTLAVKALYVLAEARNLQDDHRGCLRLIDEALPIARRLGDRLPTAHLLNMRGWALDVVGEDGRPSFEESAAQCRMAGDRRGAATAVGNTGFVALEAGDLDTAGELIGEALQVYRELGNRQGLASCAVNAGYVAYLKGDDVAAHDMFRECLDIARRIGARLNVAYAVLGLAITATRTGDGQRAATLHGVFESLFRQIGSAVEGLEARLRDADHARLRNLLGDASFEHAYQGGMRLSNDEALRLAQF